MSTVDVGEFTFRQQRLRAAGYAPVDDSRVAAPLGSESLLLDGVRLSDVRWSAPTISLRVGGRRL